MNYQEIVRALEQKLKGPKPGLKAQILMCPVPRPGDKAYFEVEDKCFKAGVLVLLYPKEDNLFLLLTRRTDHVLHHRGQISFPGGQMEADETFLQTALREAREELGISLVDANIIGELTPLYIPPSNYCIYPVVAAASTRSEFHPHTKEVAEVIEVPLGHLVNPKNIQKQTWKIRGQEVLVPFYLYQGHKIWGATAMVLAELLYLIKV